MTCPCSSFLPPDSSRHISLWADLTVSFVDVLFGLKLYLICWFSYCKDWISPSPITVGLQVDLSAVSLFCLTEVIPLRHGSLFSCLFTRGDVGDLLCKHSCVYPRKLQGVFIRLLPWATLRCSVWPQLTARHCEIYTLNQVPSDVLARECVSQPYVDPRKKSLQKQIKCKDAFPTGDCRENSAGHSLGSFNQNNGACLLSPWAHCKLGTMWRKEALGGLHLIIFMERLVATVHIDIITILA